MAADAALDVPPRTIAGGSSGQADCAVSGMLPATRPAAAAAVHHTAAAPAAHAHLRAANHAAAVLGAAQALHGLHTSTAEEGG